MTGTPDVIAAVLKGLRRKYTKILYVNATTGSFTGIDIPDDERAALAERNITTIGDYVAWFIESALIHKDDSVAFTEFMANLTPDTYLLYRRKLSGTWHTVIMDVIPGVNYRSDNKELSLYVRDINDIYLHEYKNVADKLGTTDSFTGLINKVGFLRDVKACGTKLSGILYADINGLKYTNDTLGHAAGDELILKFANLLSINFGECQVYHLSGDEFAVLNGSVPIRRFLAAAVNFHKSVWNTDGVPMASIGYSVAEPGELDAAIQDAEHAMYADKRMFYTRFPKYKRGSTCENTGEMEVK